MKNRILMTAAAALALLFPAIAQETAESPDHLRMFTGKLDAHDGAAAEGRIEEGVFTITNTADAGHIIAGGPKLLDLTPGRDYEVSCELEMAEGSSGALMIASREADKVIKALEASGIRATVIGEFTEASEGAKTIGLDGVVRPMPAPSADEIYKI